MHGWGESGDSVARCAVRRCLGAQENCVDQGGLGEARGGMGRGRRRSSRRGGRVVDESDVIGTTDPRRGRARVVLPCWLRPIAEGTGEWAPGGANCS